MIGYISNYLSSFSLPDSLFFSLPNSLFSLSPTLFSLSPRLSFFSLPDSLSFLDSHVADGSKIHRWALISFGNYPDQHSSISCFISQFSVRCHQLVIFLSRTTTAPPVFEPLQTLSSAATLESKLWQLHSAVDLELLICVMEKKHPGYNDLKRIAETEIGVITQCCLSSNI